MATADRALSILGLFTMERPEWTVDNVMSELGLSSSTAYTYIRSLVDVGLLISGKTGSYGIGPAVIGFDRIARRHDPLIHDAQSAMRALVAGAGEAGDIIALLCRPFRSQVMCVDQFSERRTSFAISYERGRPMPLYRGAASKAILAQMPSRAIRRLWETEQAQIVAAGLGNDWDQFKKTLRALRKTDVVITSGEIDTGLVGLSAPVVGSNGEVLGSLGVVVSHQTFEKHPEHAASLSGLVAKQAAAVTAALQS